MSWACATRGVQRKTSLKGTDPESSYRFQKTSTTSSRLAISSGKASRSRCSTQAWAASSVTWGRVSVRALDNPHQHLHFGRACLTGGQGEIGPCAPVLPTATRWNYPRKGKGRRVLKTLATSGARGDDCGHARRCQGISSAAGLRAEVLRRTVQGPRH